MKPARTGRLEEPKSPNTLQRYGPGYREDYERGNRANDQEGGQDGSQVYGREDDQEEDDECEDRRSDSDHSVMEGVETQQDNEEFMDPITDPSPILQQPEWFMLGPGGMSQDALLRDQEKWAMPNLQSTTQPTLPIPEPSDMVYPLCSQPYSKTKYLYNERWAQDGRERHKNRCTRPPGKVLARVSPTREIYDQGRGFEDGNDFEFRPVSLGHEERVGEVKRRLQRSSDQIVDQNPPPPPPISYNQFLHQGHFSVMPTGHLISNTPMATFPRPYTASILQPQQAQHRQWYQAPQSGNPFPGMSIGPGGTSMLPPTICQPQHGRNFSWPTTMPHPGLSQQYYPFQQQMYRPLPPSTYQNPALPVSPQMFRGYYLVPQPPVVRSTQLGSMTRHPERYPRGGRGGIVREYR
jgi:hypothetical protein